MSDSQPSLNSGDLGSEPFGTGAARPALSAWRTLAVEMAGDHRIFRVHRKRCLHPGRGSESTFVVLDAPDWVNVVAVTKAGDIVLVRQFRYGTEDFSLEVPGGVMEPGEDPIEAARRELAEETGFVGGEARVLGWVHPNPAIQNNRCHLVCIEGVAAGPDLAWDEHEEIEVSLVPRAAAIELARTGRITHALAVNAVLLYAAGVREAAGSDG
ncbi:NUDIX hydrolase [Congregicoccus parvus]|uniref:NUDIX hydrolase n=1 Tax=Congregicoccus parvus TaxID=3081749 RepID=UPI003FA5DAD3